MDAEMREAEASQVSSSGQNDVVRDLLTLARQLINQGKPSQALQAAVTTIVPPAPMATTCLAFYPQDNNILAVGMDDSSILIYNVRTNKIEILLEGHSKRVTALAFSSSSNLLVSGDINAQAYEKRDAGAVIHSRGIESCLVTMINHLSKEFRDYQTTTSPPVYISPLDLGPWRKKETIFFCLLCHLYSI